MEGLDKALTILEDEWQKHSDICDALVDKPGCTEEFYKHLHACSALNDVISRITDEYEKVAG